MLRSWFAVFVLFCGGMGPALAAPPCTELAEGSAAYSRAIRIVRKVPEVHTWSNSHSFPIAFGASTDKEVLLQGKCYWSVSVYADRPERFELWNVFFVHLPSKSVLVGELASGDPISLREWRKREGAHRTKK